MKLHFLGTGAADFDIRTASVSPDFRRNSSLLIDDCLLVDPGACLFEFAASFGYENLYASVRDIINTHSHPDHFNADTLSALVRDGAVFHPMRANEQLETDSHIIRAFEANHCTSENPVHFLIESKSDGKRIFYGCDGAWLPYSTNCALMECGPIDLMIFDCTIGDIHGDYRIFEHNNVAMVSEMRSHFLKICPRFMVSHLARTLHPSHAEAAEILKTYGFETAYDNFITEV